MKIDQTSESPLQKAKTNLYFRSRLLFTSIITLLTLFLVWPGYKLFAQPEPFILGFPLSFAWVILCTVIGFAALFWLYISDNRREEED